MKTSLSRFSFTTELFDLAGIGGHRDKGLYGGASVFFDFENRGAAKFSPLISSLYTIGYAYDCCSLALQYYTFNVGIRNENRFAFSFRLNGIGASAPSSSAKD